MGLCVAALPSELGLKITLDNSSGVMLTATVAPSFGVSQSPVWETEVMQITEVLRQCDRIRTIVWGGVGQDTTEGMIPGSPVLCLS